MCRKGLLRLTVFAGRHPRSAAAGHQGGSHTPAINTTKPGRASLAPVLSHLTGVDMGSKGSEQHSAAGHACHNQAWRQHQAEIRGFLVNRAGSAFEADDLLQEVFLKALLHGKDFCRLDNPRAWLFHVAHNLLVDRLRLAKEQVPLPDDLADESAAELAAEFAPVDLLSHCLPRVLTELSAQDREAILLCDMQGMAHKDYAARLGLSLAAAKSRVLRARLRLRTRLADACQVRFDAQGRVCCFVPRPPLESGASE